MMSQAQNERTVKVLSYNIHKGLQAFKAQKTLHLIKTQIQQLDVDFVFLQEVVGHRDGPQFHIEDWPSNAQFEYLADNLWPHFAYGKNAISSKGHHGNAILSRYPIVEWENIDISTNRFEKRGLLHCVAEEPETCQRYHLICLHLNLLENDRRKQFHRVIKRVHECIPQHDPLIVAGDLNDWRKTASSVFHKHLGLKEVFYHLYHKHPKTFPAPMPLLSLDRIYFRSLIPVKAETLTQEQWRSISDHIPLYAVFRPK